MLGVQSDQLAEQRKINERQTQVLELQARELRASLDERTREAEQQKRAQASKVDIRTEIGLDPRVGVIPRAASTPVPETVTAHVTNTSDQPIYDADIIWDDGTLSFIELTVWPGADNLAHRIGPGGSASRTKLPTDTPNAHGAVLCFRDATGTAWLRTSDGYLQDFTGGPRGGWPSGELAHHVT
jgi:hypothetical protein